MGKPAAITIRLLSALKQRLEARAKARHRSLSAQVVADLSQIDESLSTGSSEGRFLGLFEGSAVPSDADIREVRNRLWGDLGRLDRRA